MLPFSALSAATADLASLRRWLDDPANLEAVFVASPDLAEHVAAWRAKPDPDPAIERTLVRYLSRMAGRSTPFGLFSGVAIGSFGASTRMEIASRTRHGRHTRLDNDYLFSLCDELLKDPAVRAELVFTPNTSLYPSSGRWRYAEARLDGAGRSYHLVASTRRITTPCSRAQAGARLGASRGADRIRDLARRAGFIGELVPRSCSAEPAERHRSEPADALIDLLWRARRVARLRQRSARYAR